jgi:Peptidase M50B-like
VTVIGERVQTGFDGLVTVAEERPEVLAASLFALVVVSWTASWRLTRGVVTIAHEGGHAVAAVLTGRGLGGIRLHADSSGMTTSTGRGRGVGLVLTFLGGYPAPAALGLAAATLAATDRAAVALWLVIVLLALTLVQVRNAFGMLSVLATGAVVGAVAWWGSAVLQAAFVAALSWFLLFGGLRSVRELQRGRRRGFSGRVVQESDADALARLTGIPGGMWAALFWLVGVASVIAGAWLWVGGVA